MTRVYMAAEDNDAGVTVESYDMRVVVRGLIKGGLRWMLENQGPSATNAFFHQLMSDYLKEGR